MFIAQFPGITFLFLIKIKDPSFSEWRDDPKVSIQENNQNN